jgi:hypothetical protein
MLPESWDVTYDERWRECVSRILLRMLIQTLAISGLIAAITCKSWQSYSLLCCMQGLELNIRNFLAGIPLLADVRSPAMRLRHWDQLMEATKIVRDPYFRVARM